MPATSYHNLEFTIKKIPPKRVVGTGFFRVLETDKEDLVLWNYEPFFKEGVTIFATNLKIIMKYGKQYTNTDNTEIKLVDEEYNPSPQPQPQPQITTNQLGRYESQPQPQPQTPQYHGQHFQTPKVNISFTCAHCGQITTVKLKTE